MIIGNIAGFVFLPVSIIMFLNVFGITKINSILGINILLVASIGLLAIQVGDIIDSHLHGSRIIMMWIVSSILCIPGLLYILSKITTLPSALVSALPLILASFLFTEGMSSFFIGDS
ncbi:MAG: hypothetical protein V1866_03575 [archaeon]